MLIGKPDLDWARSNPLGTDAKINASLSGLRVTLVDGDLDVFGDGRVQVLAMSGHTPGHRALLVRLASGAVLLSGDLFHTRENFEKSLVPGVNVNRADTLASFDRFRRIADFHHARIVVQHAPEDFLAMPKFPAFLQ